MRQRDGTGVFYQLLYGELPAVCYVLRMPDRGVPWRILAQAMQRLVKRLTNTPRHKPAPRWHLDGDTPLWETTKQKRYDYNVKTGEFEEVRL